MRGTVGLEQLIARPRLWWAAFHGVIVDGFRFEVVSVYDICITRIESESSILREPNVSFADYNCPPQLQEA